MRKFLICTFLVVAILAMSVTPAFAIQTYFEHTGGKGMANYTLRTANSYVWVKQTYNRDNKSGIVGGQVSYGTRLTNSISGDTLTDVVSIMTGDTGEGTGAWRKSIAEGKTIWLLVNPRTTAPSGKWLIKGYWEP